MKSRTIKMNAADCFPNIRTLLMTEGFEATLSFYCTLSIFTVE